MQSSCPLRVSHEWTEVACHNGTDDPALAINALLGVVLPLKHHPAFLHFKPWHGCFDNAHLTDFLGVRVPYELFCTPIYRQQSNAHALRSRQCVIHDALRQLRARDIALQWPVVSEEYFEYVATLQSVLDYVAEDAPRPFALMEVGAGYGHWTLAAHRALQQLAGRKRKDINVEYCYILADVVDTEQTIRRLATLNGIEADGPHGWLRFFRGLVTPSGVFGSGHADSAVFAADQVSIYAESWAKRLNTSSHPRQQALSLRALLHAAPCPLDMVDIDIQGGEYALLTNDSIELLGRRARRLHVGLHAHHPWGRHGNAREDEDKALLHRFQLHGGWRVAWYWPGRFQYPTLTDWGPVLFADGVLSLVNTWRDGVCQAS